MLYVKHRLLPPEAAYIVNPDKDYFTATVSISTFAPRGSAAT